MLTTIIAVLAGLAGLILGFGAGWTRGTYVATRNRIQLFDDWT